ncbi:MAG: LysM peptidoglycan-binding domain-containing M23 family metallopeptidase [Amaricoccus sp.]
MRQSSKASAARTGRPAIAPVLLLGLALALGGCGGTDPNPFHNGANGTGSAATVPNATPDSRGVITYAKYQVVVARDGDTIDSVANRLGIAPADLARRNALPTDYLLRQGEVLLLPDSFPRSAPGLGGDVTAQPLGWSPQGAAQAIDQSPSTVPAAKPAATPAAKPAAPPAKTPFQNGQTEPLIDPVRHRVEPGETAYSIARLYGVSVTALASWNGLGPDLAVRENQELLIPIVSGANKISSAPADTQPGQGTAVGAPSSAAQPLPEDISPVETPASPDLGKYVTPPGGHLRAPVGGKVTRQYNPANPNGIGYAVAAGTPVKAAGDGEVALISEELGGQGTIVLIRHKDDLMTTYSTLENVTVKKGEQVKAGQVIGAVAPRDKPELQFDVFRGTTSVDPSTYLGG